MPNINEIESNIEKIIDVLSLPVGSVSPFDNTMKRVALLSTSWIFDSNISKPYNSTILEFPIAALVLSPIISLAALAVLIA